MDDSDIVRSIRVNVLPIPAAAASAMRARIECTCIECQQLWKLLYPEGEQTKQGGLPLSTCATLFNLARTERCDVCLEFAQAVCRDAGIAIAYASLLSPSAKHQLEQSHAIDRDRLDAARAGLWFETALACRVGAKRAAELFKEAIAVRWSLTNYLSEHCDEYGLAFTVFTERAFERAAVDFLNAIETKEASKPNE